MNYEKIKSGALALLVLISLAFTWGIWNYQPSYETIADGAEEIVTEAKIGEQRKISELLKPSKIISHQVSEHYGTVSEQELDWVMKEMSHWTFFEPQNVSTSLDETEFSRLLSGESHVELFFSSFVPFNTIKTMFSFNDTVVPNAVFNRIVITEADQENKAFVYFISVQERLVFKSQIEARSLGEFKSRYMEKSESLEPYIAYQVPNGTLLYVEEEPPVLPVRNYYYPEKISAETFKQALFKDPSYVKRGSNAGNDQYTDGSSFMRVRSDTGMIKYVNLAETAQATPLDQLIEKSINFVNEHNGWVDNYRLFKAEPGSASISYRLFLGSFPVFSSTGMTELSQTWAKDRIYSYDRSSFIINLNQPLPEETTVELQSGQEALNQVLGMETIDPVLLTEMRVGYEMTLEPKSRKILTLKPYWYYQYNGIWQKLAVDEGGQADGLE